MYINNIQSYNTSFGAKLNIEGFTKDINKSIAKQWTKKAELVGSKEDTLTLKLGKPEFEIETNGAISNPKSAIIKSRKAKMESVINNKKEEKILGYYTSENIDVFKRMTNRISEYIDFLAKKK